MGDYAGTYAISAEGWHVYISAIVFNAKTENFSLEGELYPNYVLQGKPSSLLHRIWLGLAPGLVSERGW